MSFVMHEEYLVDVPEECKRDFAYYIMEYGFYGRIPKVQGFELTFWKSVQRRIDTDKLNYKINTLKNRIGAINSRIKKNTASENDQTNLIQYQKELLVLNEQLQKITCISFNTCNTCNTHTHVSVSDSVSLSVSDNVFVSDTVSDSVFEDDDDIESGTQNPPPPPLMQTPSEEKFAEKVFEKFKNAGLPCQKGDLFKFKCADFRMALSSLKGLHSDDVLKAIDNYITELNNPDSYELKKMSFDTLVGSKTFRNCLPDIYDVSGHDNFKKYKKHNEKESPPVEHHYEICPVCGQMTFEWKNDFQMYECDNCHHKATYEEVNSA